ncbi:hypothetical protein BVY03_04815 [bacterium K02(2017)]|nr:hypothetical protein BVY03_04815 [bacterium K02(2017)]
MMRAQINNVFQGLNTSPTLAINELVARRRSLGLPTYHLGFGQSPHPVHPSIVAEKLTNRKLDDKRYIHSQGLWQARENIAGYYSKLLRPGIHADDVIISTGSKPLLMGALKVHDGPLLLPEASWVSYEPQAKLVGKQIISIPVDAENDYKIDISKLEEVLKNLPSEQQPLLLINSPNNPTGAVYNDNELKELARLSKKYGVLVLSDEIYGEVTFDGVYRSISHYYPEGTLVTGGMSKSFSAGGYRIGLMVVPDNLKDFRRAMVALLSEYNSCAESSAQYAAVKAYSGDPAIGAYTQKCNHIHQAMLHYSSNILKNVGVKVSEIGGAFYLFPDFEIMRSDLIQTSDDLALNLLDKYGVATLPGSAFLRDSNHLNLRISPVDYDGEHAHKIYDEFLSQGKDVLSDEFVELAAPNVFKGMKLIAEAAQNGF